MKAEIANKKAAALKATLELISEQGFHGTPMSQIAERAGIGVGTIYRYFAGKEALINALYIDIKTRFVRYVLHNYAPGLPVREGFKQVFSRLIIYCKEHPDELSFMEQYENSPLITAATRAEIVRLTEPWCNIYHRGREANLLKPLPLEVVSALIMGAVISLVKHYLSGTVELQEDLLDQALDAIWDMVKC